MPHEPIVTTVVGSYPIPGWLELSGTQLAAFGPTDIAELWDDAVTVSVADQLRAGLDVITDGEQTRTDFNLSFYAFLQGVELNSSPPRRFGPPGHDQRPMHQISGELRAPSGLGVVDEFKRLQRLAHISPPPQGEGRVGVSRNRRATFSGWFDSDRIAKYSRPMGPWLHRFGAPRAGSVVQRGRAKNLPAGRFFSLVGPR